MHEQKMIEIINEELGNHKQDFLKQVKEDIYNHIASLNSSDCLTIIEEDYNSTRWVPSQSLNGYIPRFIAFLRGEKYKNNSLNSALTDPVVNIVISTYDKFVQSHTKLIIKPLLEKALNNDIVINSIAQQAVEKWQGDLSYALKKVLISKLVERIEDAISTNIAHISSDAVSSAATKIITTAATLPISKTIIIILIKHLSITLKGVVAKILASAAVKTMLATMVKKFVAAKILVIVIGALGSKLAGISVGWILAPLIIAFIAYEIHTLPTKMAKNISEAVEKELNGEFVRLNTNIASSIAREIGQTAINAFIADVINDVSMKDIVINISQEIKR